MNKPINKYEQAIYDFLLPYKESGVLSVLEQQKEFNWVLPLTNKKKRYTSDLYIEYSHTSFDELSNCGDFKIGTLAIYKVAIELKGFQGKEKWEAKRAFWKEHLKEYGIDIWEINSCFSSKAKNSIKELRFGDINKFKDWFKEIIK